MSNTLRVNTLLLSCIKKMSLLRHFRHCLHGKWRFAVATENIWTTSLLCYENRTIEVAVTKAALTASTKIISFMSRGWQLLLQIISLLHQPTCSIVAFNFARIIIGLLNQLNHLFCTTEYKTIDARSVRPEWKFSQDQGQISRSNVNL